MHPVEVELQVAHLRNAHRVRDGVGRVRVEGRHLLHAPQVVGVLVHLQPLGVVDVGVRVDADQDVLERRVLLHDVVAVVCGRYGNAQVTVELHQPRVDLRKLLDASVLHQLQVVVGEALPVPRDRCCRVVHASLGYEARHLAAGAARQDDQALVMSVQQLSVHPRVVVEPLEVGRSDELDQVTVACLVLRQHGHVVGLLVVGVPVVPASRRDIHLAADDRRYPVRPGSLVEVDGPVQPAVIGYRQVAHAELRRPLDERFDTAQPVEETELSVIVQMRKQPAAYLDRSLQMIVCRMPALRPTCGRRLTHARERLGAPACANYTGVETPQIKALEWAFGVDLTTIYWTSEIVTHNKLWPRRLWLRARLHRRRVTRPHAPAQRRSPADGPSVAPGSAGTQKCEVEGGPVWQGRTTATRCVPSSGDQSLTQSPESCLIPFCFDYAVN